LLKTSFYPAVDTIEVTESINKKSIDKIITHQNSTRHQRNSNNQPTPTKKKEHKTVGKQKKGNKNKNISYYNGGK
jgi:hypothetical protein